MLDIADRSICQCLSRCSVKVSGQFIYALTPQGWRVATSFVVVLMVLVGLPLVMILMVDHPGLKGIAPYGAKGTAVSAQVPDPKRSVVLSMQFWLLAFSFGICGFTTSGLFQMHLIQHGIPEMAMAVSLGLMGVTDIIGSVFSGWLCDRFGR